MAFILSIDTSTTVCSAALHGDGTLLGRSSIYVDKSHAGQLGPVIRQLLTSCDVSEQMLDAVAVSEGPGSYTGLRIGCSLAKGMCFALNIPLIAVSTLEALALQVIPLVRENDLLCPMLDARRMEVYTMTLDTKRKVLQEVHPLILEEKSFENELKELKVWFFGNGSDKAREVISHENAVFLKEIRTEAVTIGQIAFEKYLAEDFADVAYFEPFYLKEFQATKPKKRL